MMVWVSVGRLVRPPSLYYLLCLPPFCSFVKKCYANSKKIIISITSIIIKYIKWSNSSYDCLRKIHNFSNSCVREHPKTSCTTSWWWCHPRRWHSLLMTIVWYGTHQCSWKFYLYCRIYSYVEKYCECTCGGVHTTVLAGVVITLSSLSCHYHCHHYLLDFTVGTYYHKQHLHATIDAKGSILMK